jgi:hypothetical protein
VLTVVQHQQGAAIGQGGQHRVVDAAALLLAQAERGRDGGADHRRIGDRHQVDEPHAVGEVAGQVRGDGQRQSGLAHAAGSDGSDLTVRLDGVAQFGALLGSADERVQRRREAGQRLAGPLGPGELGCEVGERPPIRCPELAQ